MSSVIKDATIVDLGSKKPEEVLKSNSDWVNEMLVDGSEGKFDPFTNDLDLLKKAIDVNPDEVVSYARCAGTGYNNDCHIFSENIANMAMRMCDKKFDEVDYVKFLDHCHNKTGRIASENNSVMRRSVEYAGYLLKNQPKLFDDNVESIMNGLSDLDMQRDSSELSKGESNKCDKKRGHKGFYSDEKVISLMSDMVKKSKSYIKYMSMPNGVRLAVQANPDNFVEIYKSHKKLNELRLKKKGCVSRGSAKPSKKERLGAWVDAKKTIFTKSAKEGVYNR